MDNNQQDTVDTTLPESPTAEQSNHTPEPKVSPKKSNRRYASSWWVRVSLLLVFLLAVAGLGIAYYLFTQLQIQQQQTLQLTDELQQSLLSPLQRINSLEEQQQQDTQTSQHVSRLEAEQALLQERVATLSQRSPHHWMAAEAEYLVRMAGRKLWLEKDPQTAAGLLTAADERIEAMQDPALLPLRKALAHDIGNVNAIKGTDIAGTVFTLDALIGKLDKLSLNRSRSQAGEDVSASQGMTDSIDDWQTNLAKTWQALTEDFITIRKRTTDIAPLLSPEQQWYLVENIRNKLLQSQLALYRYDEVNYRQSLTMARKWIYQYFDLNDIATKETLDALDALVTLKLDPVTINKFESTARLKQLITYGELMSIEEQSQ